MSTSTADIQGPASAAIITPVDGPAGRFYRRVLTLSFQTGGAPDRVVIDEQAAAFDAQFSGSDYNVLDPSSPVRHTGLTKKDAYTLVVTIDRPWRINRVHLDIDDGVVSAGTNPWACAVQADPRWMFSMGSYIREMAQYYTSAVVLLFRVDGEAIAEEATITAANGQTLPEPFISRHFAIRAVNAGGEPMALETGDLSLIEIHTYPTGPRIGLANPESLEPQGYFWQVPGEVGVLADQDAANAGAAEGFSKALQRYLDDVLEDIRTAAEQAGTLPVIPDQIETAMVLETDAPCQYSLDLEADYFLERRTFPVEEGQTEPLDKQVLRFNGEQLATRCLSLLLPPHARIQTACLKVDASFGAQPAVAVGPPPAIPSGDQDAGLYLDQDQWVAQQVSPAAPVKVADIALGLMALGPGVEVMLEIRQGDDATPLGQILCSGQAALSTAGVRQYTRFRLDQPVTLHARTYWIVMTAVGGAAVWLSRPQPGSCIHVVEKSSSTCSSKTVIKDRQTLYTFLSDAARVTKEKPPVSVAIGPYAVSSRFENGNLIIAENTLTAAITDYLSDLTPPAPGDTSSIDVPIAFTTPLKGQITVYPPQIRFLS
jgi:hypothetical protein